MLATRIQLLWNGDSVSSTTKSLITGDGKNMIQLSWQNINGENYLCVTVNYVTALKIRANV